MTSEAIQNFKLEYTILYEDVRIELSHKLSLMGVFYAVQVPQLPATLLKMAILNHWSGSGQYLSEVRILTPDRTQPVAVSPPAPFEVPLDGFADNVTIFANVTFPASGVYILQTLVNSNAYTEHTLGVCSTTYPHAAVWSDTIQWSAFRLSASPLRVSPHRVSASLLSASPLPSSPRSPLTLHL